MKNSQEIEQKLKTFYKENTHLRKDNAKLSKHAHKLLSRVEDLEDIVQGFEKLQELSNTEKKDADSLIKAHESVGMLATKEIDILSKTVRAHEAVEKLAALEINDLNKTVHAQEAVQELARTEIITLKKASEEINEDNNIDVELKHAENTIKAFEDLQEFQRKQFMYYEKVIKAYERVGDLFNNELKQMDTVIKAHEVVEEMARAEMIDIKERQADATLENRETVERLKLEITNSEKTIDALDLLMERQRSTKVNLDQTITAYKSLSELSKDELDNAYRTIRVHEEIERLTWDEQKDLDEDLMMAQKIQFGLITHGLPDFNRIKICNRYLPSTWLGGDFYAAKYTDDNRITLFISDAAGHGTQAALIVMIVKTLFEEYAQKFKNPASFLKKMNTRLFSIIGNVKTFITALVMVIDTKKMTLNYANGGHPYGFIKRKNGTMHLLKKTGPLLGAFDNMKYRSSEINLESGDLIFTYTDGALECTNSSEEEYGQDRLENLIKNYHGNNAEGLLDTLQKELILFHGSSQMEDDVSLMALEIP